MGHIIYHRVNLKCKNHTCFICILILFQIRMEMVMPLTSEVSPFTAAIYTNFMLPWYFFLKSKISTVHFAFKPLSAVCVFMYTYINKPVFKYKYLYWRTQLLHLSHK